MIVIDNNFVHFQTKNNSYLIHINKYGDLENLYYGSKIANVDFDLFVKKRSFIVNTLFEKEDMSYCIDGMNFEFSTPFRGDSRSSSLIIHDNDNSMTDFVFDKILKAGFDIKNMPMPMPKGGEYFGLQFKDNLRDGLLLQLWYIVYEEKDVICKFVNIVNDSDKNISIKKVMSAQFDMPKGNKNICIFEGAWGRERQRKEIPITSGKITAGSFCGMSSAECNPFFIVCDNKSTETNGNAYAFNLMYSGSHEIGVESTPYDSIRITHGVQSEGFNYNLKKNCSFMSPVSVSTFSNLGIGKVSENMQIFASENIIPKKQIPIMLNSWESVYFDLNEQKLIKFADKAKCLGFDGVVIDDGWFGGRNDDTTSLGDWFENKEKFPNGIKAYSEYLTSIGLTLGIWIEPEMISEKSELYKNHPDWALKCKNAKEIVGRNQLILDLTKDEVADYIYKSLQRLVKDYGARYIKWDFNRRFADITGNEGSAYFYKYYVSLYKILSKFTSNYPNVILENCASGGGRFDLGMMSFAPISWVSDNTDPLSRAEIQQGSSYGYPIRVMLNHISASPSHLTKRITSFETRKNTALIGSFGAQYDITSIPDKECEEIKNANAEYREIEDIIQNGYLYRLSEDDNLIVWQVMHKDRGIVYLMQKRFYSVSSLPSIKLVGLEEKSSYSVIGGALRFVQKGKTLMNGGIVLPMNYQGCGEGQINLTDMSTMLFKITKN